MPPLVEPVPPRKLTPANLSPRMRAVVRMERIMLAVRYAGYLLIAAYHVWGSAPDLVPNLLLLTIGAIVHNSFVHWVIYRREYEWFVSPVNFFIHLGKVSLLVAITGGEESPAALLYLMILIGYCIYVPRLRGTFRVTTVTCLAYAVTLLLHWTFAGIGLSEGPILVHLAAIGVCGAMLNVLGRLMRHIEKEGQQRAAELASSEATLRAILDSAATPILVYEESEFISEANGAACQLLGVPRERLLGKRFRAFLFDDGTLPNKLAALRNKGEYSGEALVLAEDGAERNINLLARSFVRETQRFFVAIMQDITEQKNIQEDQRLATLQLEQANRELQRVHDLRTAFFTTISRSLRSPLSAVLGQLDMLHQGELGPVTDSQRRALQSARRSAERVFAMLDEAFEVQSLAPRASAKAPESTAAK